jgi:hypothetical protein
MLVAFSDNMFETLTYHVALDAETDHPAFQIYDSQNPSPSVSNLGALILSNRRGLSIVSS